MKCVPSWAACAVASPSSQGQLPAAHSHLRSLSSWLLCLAYVSTVAFLCHCHLKCCVLQGVLFVLQTASHTDGATPENKEKGTAVRITLHRQLD